MMPQGDIVNNVDEDQSAQNEQSDLWSTLSTSTFEIIITCKLFLHLGMEFYF